MQARRAVLPILAFAVLAVLAGAMPSALAEGQPRPGWLGVTLAPVEVPAPVGESNDTSALMPAADLPPAGVRISAIVRDSPADRAGLRASDVLLRIDGRAVDSPRSVIAAVSGHEAGHNVELAFVRRGEERSLIVRLGEMPPQRGRLAVKRGTIGAAPIDVPLGLREYWGGGEERGVLVGEVERGSAADRAGLRPGDLVLAVDGNDVVEASALWRLVLEGGIGNELEVEISRQGAFMTLEVEIEELIEDPDEE